MARKENEKGGTESRDEERRRVAKWYTIVEYYNESGEQITARNAKKNYVISEKIKTVEINGTRGTIKWWYKCERDRQLRLF